MALNDFLTSIKGRTVTVKLSSGVEYSGSLVCLDGYMNIALQDTQEMENGRIVNSLGDSFIRGNNDGGFSLFGIVTIDNVLEFHTETNIFRRISKNLAPSDCDFTSFLECEVDNLIISSTEDGLFKTIEKVVDRVVYTVATIEDPHFMRLENVINIIQDNDHTIFVIHFEENVTLDLKISVKSPVDVEYSIGKKIKTATVPATLSESVFELSLDYDFTIAHNFVFQKSLHNFGYNDPQTKKFCDIFKDKSCTDGRFEFKEAGPVIDVYLHSIKIGSISEEIMEINNVQNVFSFVGGTGLFLHVNKEFFPIKIDSKKDIKYGFNGPKELPFVGQKIVKILRTVDLDIDGKFLLQKGGMISVLDENGKDHPCARNPQQQFQTCESLDLSVAKLRDNIFTLRLSEEKVPQIAIGTLTAQALYFTKVDKIMRAKNSPFLFLEINGKNIYLEFLSRTKAMIGYSYGDHVSIGSIS